MEIPMGCCGTSFQGIRVRSAVDENDNLFRGYKGISLDHIVICQIIAVACCEGRQFLTIFNKEGGGHAFLVEVEAHPKIPVLSSCYFEREPATLIIMFPTEEGLQEILKNHRLFLGLQ